MEGFRAHCLTGSLSAMDKPVVRDAALLIFRATLGLIFVAHGWQKLFMDGPVETAGKLSAAGIPQAKLSAYIVGGGELLGGALLEGSDFSPRRVWKNLFTSLVLMVTTDSP